jgi:hypothetical protein
MIRHCFTLDQQQKVTKLKYIANKGYAILDEANLDDIINAVAGADIYDTTLGLLDKEQRTAAMSKGYDASAIMFGEAKEGAVEAHNFSFEASVTTIHSKNMDDSRTVATESTLAKSVFSLATSKVTSDSSAEELDDDSDLDDDRGTEKSDVAIERMHMLSGHCRKSSRGDPMQEVEVPGDNKKRTRMRKNKSIIKRRQHVA